MDANKNDEEINRQNLEELIQSFLLNLNSFPATTVEENSIAGQIQKIKLEERRKQLESNSSNLYAAVTKEQATSSMMEICQQIGEKFANLANENAKFREENRGLKAEIDGKNQKLEEQAKELIWLRGEVASLNSEFAKLYAGNRANSHKNDEKMASISEQQNEGTNKEVIKLNRQNNWNAHIGQRAKLTISENGHFLRHIGVKNGWISVLAETPIQIQWDGVKNRYIAGYYELEILQNGNDFYGGGYHSNIKTGICIGFCCPNFPINGIVGIEPDSFGICCKTRLRINGMMACFGKKKHKIRYFQEGNVIGCGVVCWPSQSQLQCFVACDGQLCGHASVPLKFTKQPLFPAVSLFDTGNSMRTNFGQNNWCYNPERLLNE